MEKVTGMEGKVVVTSRERNSTEISDTSDTYLLDGYL